jgi:hypothetical protein
MRRTIKRRYKNRITCKRIYGGDKIGEGNTASVYRPPINCDPPFISENNKDNYISKVFNYNSTNSDENEGIAADKEMAAAKLIEERVPDANEFILLPIHICKTNSKTSIIYKYGGKTINYFYNKNKSYNNRIIEALINLYPYIIKLNNVNICHGDIFGANIVFNEETGKAYLIDLEKVRDFDTIIDKTLKLLYNKNVSEKRIQNEINMIYNRDVKGLARTVDNFIEKNYKKIYKSLEKDNINYMVINSKISPEDYKKNIRTFFDIVLEKIKENSQNLPK